MRKYFWAATFLSVGLFANPKEATVFHGNAKFENPAPEILQITTDDKVILHWNNFSIAENETTKFIQPNISSIAINKVITGNPSELLGRLEANGHIVLINPNGILVGEHAVINTANFMAISFDYPEEQLLQTGSSKDPVFIFPKSDNPGNPFATAIQHKGIIEASGSKEEGGRVYLIADSGTVKVSGSITAASGNVQVLGEYVQINGATIDVSGDFKAGTVLIGGDYKGQNPQVINAKQTALDADARIFADAKISGDGGRVIIWSDEATGHYGQISVQGGSESGNGGFVEVSGKKYLDYRGTANCLARMGDTGKLLLDPTDITISVAVDSPGVVPGPTYNIDGVAVNPANINIPILITQLGLSNVEISTAANPGLGAQGDLTLVDALTWISGNSLTLIADRDVNVENLLQCTMGGSLGISAERDVNVGPSLSSSTVVTQPLSSINLTSGIVAISAGRDVIVQAATIAGPVASPSSILTTTGNIAIAAGRDVQLIASPDTGVTSDVAEITTTDGNIFINSGENLNLIAGANDGAHAQIVSTNQSVFFAAYGNVLLQGGNGAMLSSAQITAGSEINGFSGGNLSLFSGPFGAAKITASSTLTLFAGNDLQLTGVAAAPATISSSNANMNISAGNNILLESDSLISLSGIFDNSLLVAAGNNMILTGNAQIFNFSTGDLTLVVDNKHPTPPGIGSGGFFLGPSAKVFKNFLGGGPIRIFTARQSQNSIQGQIGTGLLFTPGTPFVNTTQEVWGIYYPRSVLGIPFTIFYKDIFVPNSVLHAFNNAVFEYLQDLGMQDDAYFIRKEFYVDYHASLTRTKPYEGLSKTPHAVLRRDEERLLGRKMR